MRAFLNKWTRQKYMDKRVKEVAFLRKAYKKAKEAISKENRQPGFAAEERSDLPEWLVLANKELRKDCDFCVNGVSAPKKNIGVLISRARKIAAAKKRRSDANLNRLTELPKKLPDQPSKLLKKQNEKPIVLARKIAAAKRCRDRSFDRSQKIGSDSDENCNLGYSLYADGKR